MALANSCNCYFVNLALLLGKDKLYDTCNKLGYNDETELFNKWIIKNANIPTLEDLSVNGELALFGFGQGKLTVTPLQIANSLCVIVNGGMKNESRLILNTVNNIRQAELINYPSPISVLSNDTCSTLLDYMSYVVTNGTASNA